MRLHSRLLVDVEHAKGRTQACSGARESVFAAIRRLRRAPADAWRVMQPRR
jgi:hypothetical protein